MNSVTSFKICPKCNFPSTSKSECSKCGVQFADIRKAGQLEHIPRVQCDEPQCTTEAFCKVGTRNVCETHYLTAERPAVDPEKGYRGRWYAERGLAYEPPNKPASSDKLAAWTALHGHLPKRPREPGDDEEYRT